MVGEKTRVTRLAKKIFKNDQSKSVNPDKVVSMGVTVKGGVFRGDDKDILLLDVTPLLFSLETLGGVSRA